MGAEGFVPGKQTLLREYYAIREWDQASGKPSRDQLVGLDLPGVARDLWSP